MRSQEHNQQSGIAAPVHAGTYRPLPSVYTRNCTQDMRLQ